MWLRVPCAGASLQQSAFVKKKHQMAGQTRKSLFQIEVLNVEEPRETQDFRYLGLPWPLTAQK